MNTQPTTKNFIEVLKTQIEKAEPILLIVFLALLLLKTSGIHLSIISILLIVIGGSISLMYLLYSWSIKKTGDLPNIFYVTIKISYFSLSILTIGCLYKIQFWSMSLAALLAGSILGTIGAFGLYYFKNNWDAYEPIINLNQLFKRVLGVLFIGLLLLSIDDIKLFRIVYADEPEKVTLYELMVNNPHDITYRKAYQEYNLRKKNSD